MKNISCDVLVVGAGAAGLCAGSVTSKHGLDTIIIDREDQPGGILKQCIHNGFGLRYFKEELTGPEYACRVAKLAADAGAKIMTGTTAVEAKKNGDDSFTFKVFSQKEKVCYISSKAVLFTTGCRERTRGNIITPGTRPAGVFTAGAAQKLLNISGYLPGKCAVIVGSGDIGLIMARRLKWCGIDVKAVVEIMRHPSGLTRNIVQCLDDFGIPLYLGHSVTNIYGKDRVEAVDITPLADGKPDFSKTFKVDCDTLLFSVGLVPEVELAKQLEVKINPATGGAFVDDDYETTTPMVFASGNGLHVHDLVDFVSEESERAAGSICRRLSGAKNSDKVPVTVEKTLKYVVPTQATRGEKQSFYFRPLIVANKATLEARADGEVIKKRLIPFVRPAEMLEFELEIPAECKEMEFALTGGELL